MTRYVITPDVALSLTRAGAVVGGEHQLLAPTLLRSQLLSSLFAAARTEVPVASLGDLTRPRVSPAARGGHPPRHPA